MSSFWQGLAKPFFIQAPMEDVTDVAFRTLIARFGKPDVMYTEFTSADGLVLAPEQGKKSLLKKLEYGEGERPIVAQLFSALPERMEAAANLAAKLGFDGVDINMGCPDRAVERGGAGAALIKNPALARALIRAAKKSDLPISVKTRIGYNTEAIDEWLRAVLEEKPAHLAVHLRTRKEMSDVPAHWDLMPRILQLRNEVSPETLVSGNGDVHDIADARSKVAAYGCDGVMLGRAIYGNPWLYANRSEAPSPQERIAALIEHITLFDEKMGAVSNFATMKKHFKAYISGWDGAKELRVHLMETNTAREAVEVLENSQT